MKINRTHYLFTLPFLIAATCFAESKTLKVDAAASELTFELGASLHAVHGLFKIQSGVIDFDPAATRISGKVIVSAASGNTDDDGRDKKMKKDVLDVAHFAEVTFAPASYTGTLASTGDSTIQVTGQFTLLGKPHEITVPMQIHIEGNKATAKTKFSVPFVKWGLKDPSNMLLKVNKEVEVSLNLTGVVLGAQ